MRRFASVALLFAGLSSVVAHADDEISTAVFVRTDTDGTTVVSPSVEGRVGVVDDETSVSVGYGADVWTSASIDIRTAASIRVTEQRDEITVGVEREMRDVTLRGGYRFSHEVDYVSHGGSVGVVQRLAEGNATVETALSASVDSVGRAGDDAFERTVSTVGARIVFTQVLDPETVLQGTYDIGRREGYQASPYRFVAVGGDGSCNGDAPLCLPEAHPGVRLRHAWLVRARRAFGDDLSAGLGYRLYLDDWGIVSHTAVAQLAWLPDDDSTFVARYRFYWQDEASFYQARYPTPTGRLRFVTRDRELSPISTHRLALSYERSFDLTEAGPVLKLTAAVGGSLLDYRDFIGLDTVFAFDATVAATVEL